MKEIAGDRRSVLIAAATVVAGAVLPKAHASAASDSAADKAQIPSFKQSMAVGTALGLSLPDTRAVSEAYDHAKDVYQPFLFNHAARSWFYSAKLAHNRKIALDDEVLGIASLLHDLSLAQGGAPDRRFEVHGADLARTFALSHSILPVRAETIWDSIALHATPSIGRFKGVNVAIFSNGIGADYGGVSYDELAESDKETILKAYPRLRFKENFTRCLYGVAKNHPETAADNFLADFGERYIPGFKRFSSVDFLNAAPFSE